MKDLENLIPSVNTLPSAPPLNNSFEEAIIKIPGAIAHLIDKQHSIELACGDFYILCFHQGSDLVTIHARIGNVQWPLAKDEAVVKLDDSHYFFSLCVPKGHGSGSSNKEEDLENPLNYGLTFAAKGQGDLLKNLDAILEKYSSFLVHKVSDKSEMLDGSVERKVAPTEMLGSEEKKGMMEERSAAYWTTLAPNVEEYSGSVAKAIALGSGKLIKGILWCGDVTVDRLKWGNEMLKKRLEPNAEPAEISKEALRRVQRIGSVSRMSEKVAGGILSGAVKVSGFFTSSVANSRTGKKVVGLLPEEVIVASLDGFGMENKQGTLHMKAWALQDTQSELHGLSSSYEKHSIQRVSSSPRELLRLL